MATKGKLLIASAIMIVGGVLMLLFFDTRGPEPAFVCAAENSPTAGFSDASQNDCPISIESYNAWQEWDKPQYGRIAGLGIAVAGLVVGIVGLVKKSPNKKHQA